MCLKGKENNAGFTLVEILVVVGIVAVLATVTVLILNPAELLKEARDAIRLTDLKNIDKAFSFYQADVSAGSLGNMDTVYLSLPSNQPNCSTYSLPALPPSWSYACKTEADYRKADGTGWIPVNFNQISYGTPLLLLPVDPVNNATSGLYYTYVRGSWEVTALMESGAYLSNGSKDVVTRDGGDSGSRYEIGERLTITPDIGTGAVAGGGGGGDTTPPLRSNSFPTGSLPSGTTTTTISLTTDENATCKYGTVAGVAYSSMTNIFQTTGFMNHSQPITGLTDGQNYTYYVRCEDFATSTTNVNTTDFTISFSVALAVTPGKYWVGGTGDWSDTLHWASSSGGVGGVGLPTNADDVYFDANSFTAAGQTVTVNATATMRSMNWAGVLNNPTLAGASTMNIYGSFTLASGMTRTFTGAMNFLSVNTGNIISLAGKTLASNINFNGTGGAWTLQDAFTTTLTVQFVAGNLDANNQNLSMLLFNSPVTNIRTLMMGSGTWTITGAGIIWNIAATNLTFDAGTSRILITDISAAVKAFVGGARTYYTLEVAAAGSGSIAYFADSNTFTNITVSAAPVSIMFAGGTTQTVTGTFTANGFVGNLITLRSNPSPTTYTITAAAANLSYVDVQDSIGSGAASPFNCGLTCVNSGNNTGWFFQATFIKEPTTTVMSSGEVGVPIFHSDPNIYKDADGYHLFVTSFFCNKAGTYYYSWDSDDPPATCNILDTIHGTLYAFSTDQGNTWTIRPTPIMFPGLEEWHNNKIETPFVSVVGNTLYLFYSATGDLGGVPLDDRFQIGVATLNLAGRSVRQALLIDGDVVTKRTTPLVPYNTSTTSINNNTQEPSIVYRNGQFELFYIGLGVNLPNQSIGAPGQSITSVNFLRSYFDTNLNLLSGPVMLNTTAFVNITEVRFFNNRYHLFFTTSNNQIGYANSNNGTTWINQQTVLVPGPTVYDSFGMIAPTVAVESNKTNLFYTGWEVQPIACFPVPPGGRYGLPTSTSTCLYANLGRAVSFDLTQ